MEVENDIKPLTFEDKITIRSRMLPTEDFKKCIQISKKLEEYEDSINIVDVWEKLLKEEFPECQKVIKLALKDLNNLEVPFDAYAARYKKNMPWLFLVIYHKGKEEKDVPKVIFACEYQMDLFDEGPFIKPE